MDATTQPLDLTSFATEVYYKGQGPTLLLIPGAGAAKSSWYPIIDRLSSHVRCVTYDNRGVGQASDVGDSLSVDDLADDAAAVIATLDEGPVHVCGVSMGGKIAMALTARHTDLVRSLGLHSTAAALDQRVHDVNELRFQLIDHGVPTEVLRRFVALTAEGSAGLTFELPGGVVNTETFSKHNYVGQLRAAQAHTMTEAAVASISCPTLITVGSDDMLTTPENARFLHRTIPNSKMVTVEGGGHGYYLDDPDIVAILQGGWVAQHS